MAGTAVCLLALSVPALGGDPVADPLVRVALEELAKLDRFEGTPRARQRILIRNLSRYFATYPLASDVDSLSGLLALVERLSLDFAATLMDRCAVAGTVERRPIDGRAISAATADLLPATANPYQEIVFFPHLPPSDRVVIETFDLEALRDSGLVWDLLLAFAQQETPAQRMPLPLTEDGARRFAGSVNAYALLLLRLGGQLAREAQASGLEVEHVEAAAELVAARAAGGVETDPPAAEAPPVGGPFTDVTEASGLQFRHQTSSWLSRFRRYATLAPTFSGGGATAADLDGDGWTDLIFCGGFGCRAFRNEAGRFTRHRAAAAIEVAGEARMAISADFDNDGVKDLFVTYARETNRLFQGLASGRFLDRTAESGLERAGDISGPAIAFDYDGDGDLDLYVGNFGNYLRGRHPWLSDNADNATPNRLYRNRGGLRFEEVTEAAGVGNTGWSQAVSHFDHDDDGDQDVYVANDFGRNELFRNNGDGTFSAIGAQAGADDPHHGMNVAFADLNGDRRADIFVTNIWAWRPKEKRLAESNSLLLSAATEDGGTEYRKSRRGSLLDKDTGWAWGAVFFDLENDGDDDLYLANGLTDYLTFTQFRARRDDADRLYPISNSREPNHLFRNDDGLPTVHVENSGADLEGVNSRGVATLDHDLDGDLDLAVSTFHSWARLFRNNNEGKGGWLRLRLIGEPGSGDNPDAIGTRVIARGTGDESLYVWRAVTGGEGYLSMSSPEVEIGLGAVSDVRLDIYWPGGHRQRIEAPPAGKTLTIRHVEPPSGGSGGA